MLLFCEISKQNLYFYIFGFLWSLTIIECCDHYELKHDIYKLEYDLKKKVFGQPIVKSVLVNAISSHIKLKEPSKALLLSFHGSTGTGKNYVAKIIAESLFTNGMDSKYVTFFTSTRDFPHNERINEYKDLLKDKIEKSLKSCPHTLFIFDEIDKAPVNLTNFIKPYVDVDPYIKDIDSRRSIFIFLSNSASKLINEKTLALKKQSTAREKFEIKMFRDAIENYLYNTRGSDDKGLWHTNLISSQLIDYYIPFLPLERIHVRQCAIKEFEKYEIDVNLYESFIDAVLDELNYEPHVDPKKFSVSGCKRIPQLVRKLIFDKREELKIEL